MPRLIPPKIRALRERLLSAQYDALMLRNLEAQGVLINRERVEHQIGDMIARTRMVALAMPGKISGEIAEIVGADRGQVLAILRKCVHQALNELAAGEAQVAAEARAKLEVELAPLPAKKKRRPHRKTGRPMGRPPGSPSIV